MVNGFSPSRSFHCSQGQRRPALALRVGPSLYPRLNVRVAPVGPLHLPIKAFNRLGSGLPCLDLRLQLSLSWLALELGFPEFESIHLANFSAKAQFSKSAASTIPPRPQVLPLITCSVNAAAWISIPPLTGADCNRLYRIVLSNGCWWAPTDRW
jgi:hypothetical protein